MISLFAIMRIFLLPEIIPYYMAYFSLMLKVLLNCGVIIHNLSNRNKTKPVIRDSSAFTDTV